MITLKKYIKDLQSIISKNPEFEKWYLQLNPQCMNEKKEVTQSFKELIKQHEI